MNGIYIIHNTVTNTIYIGQTGKSFNYREKRHKTMLRGGYHSNRHLQNAYNKYGESAFEFDTLEELNTVDTDALDEAEKFWIAYYKSIGADMYNLAAVGKSALGIKRSNETKSKVSTAKKDHWLDDNYRKKILETSLPNLVKTPERIAKHIAAISKTYTVKSPEGECIVLKNLREFCRIHNLNNGAMYQVVLGKTTQYKGWKRCD